MGTLHFMETAVFAGAHDQPRRKGAAGDETASRWSSALLHVYTLIVYTLSVFSMRFSTPGPKTGTKGPVGTTSEAGSA